MTWKEAFRRWFDYLPVSRREFDSLLDGTGIILEVPDKFFHPIDVEGFLAAALTLARRVDPVFCDSLTNGDSLREQPKDAAAKIAELADLGALDARLESGRRAAVRSGARG